MEKLGIEKLAAALRALMVFSFLLGVIYPLIVTGFAQLFFKSKSHGSLIYGEKGNVVGSELIGQKFSGGTYFWLRPSSNDYATLPAGASHLSPGSKLLLSRVEAGRGIYGPSAPADLLTSSGSGVDPHISVEGAMVQVARVAQHRKRSADEIKHLVEEWTQDPQWGVYGRSRVNVLKLNIDLDKKFP